MQEANLSPEQQAEFDALSLEWQQQLKRVAVDLRDASPLREIAPSVERQVSNDESEVEFTIDISGEVEALRGLPDEAGTAAFVAAYNARHADAGAPPAGDLAIRFRTRPLAEADANRLHAELGAMIPVRDVWLGGDDGAEWVGAIAPVDISEAALEAVMERLRSDSRLHSSPISVGRFPFSLGA